MPVEGAPFAESVSARGADCSLVLTGVAAHHVTHKVLPFLGYIEQFKGPISGKI